MTPFEELFNDLFNISIWSVGKTAVLIALVLYMVFSIMIIREVDAMNKTLIGVFNLPIYILAWIHAFFSIGVFILALIIL